MEGLRKRLLRCGFLHRRPGRDLVRVSGDVDDREQHHPRMHTTMFCPKPTSPANSSSLFFGEQRENQTPGSGVRQLSPTCQEAALR